MSTLKSDIIGSEIIFFLASNFFASSVVLPLKTGDWVFSPLLPGEPSDRVLLPKHHCGQLKTCLKKLKMKTSLKNWNWKPAWKSWYQKNHHKKTWNFKRAHIFLSFKNYFEGSPLQSCELPSKGLLATPQRESEIQTDCCKNPGEVDFFHFDQVVWRTTCFV